MIVLRCDRCGGVICERPGISALSLHLEQGEHRNGIGDLVSGRISDWVYCGLCYGEVVEVVKKVNEEGKK